MEQNTKFVIKDHRLNPDPRDVFLLCAPLIDMCHEPIGAHHEIVRGYFNNAMVIGHHPHNHHSKLMYNPNSVYFEIYDPLERVVEDASSTNK